MPPEPHPAGKQRARHDYADIACRRSEGHLPESKAGRVKKNTWLKGSHLVSEKAMECAQVTWLSNLQRITPLITIALLVNCCVKMLSNTSSARNKPNRHSGYLYLDIDTVELPDAVIQCYYFCKLEAIVSVSCRAVQYRVPWSSYLSPDIHSKTKQYGLYTKKSRQNSPIVSIVNTFYYSPASMLTFEGHTTYSRKEHKLASRLHRSHQANTLVLTRKPRGNTLTASSMSQCKKHVMALIMRTSIANLLVARVRYGECALNM